jgi:malate permease and related proteins
LLDKDLFYYSAIRLLGIPLLILFVMKGLGCDALLTGVTVLLAAMPAGSTTVLLADSYGGNSEYASACVFLSTVLSLVTLPVISTLLFM